MTDIQPSLAIRVNREDDSDLCTPSIPRASEVHDLVRGLMIKLEKILNGADLRNGCQSWPKDAKRLRDTKYLLHTIVVIGRTGAGKSTVMNGVFRNLLLRSASDVCHSLLAFQDSTSTDDYANRGEY